MYKVQLSIPTPHHQRRSIGNLFSLITLFALAVASPVHGQTGVPSEPDHSWELLIPAGDISDNEYSFSEFAFDPRSGTLYSLNTTKVTA